MRGWSHEQSIEAVFPEVRERAVRLFLEQQARTWIAVGSDEFDREQDRHAHRKACANGYAQAERDAGTRGGLTSSETQQRLKVLERENLELKRANEILRKACRFFRPGGTRPPTEVMVSFIDDHRCKYGVESICEPVADRPIGVTTSRKHDKRARERSPPRVRRDIASWLARFTPCIRRRTSKSMVHERYGCSSGAKTSGLRLAARSSALMRISWTTGRSVRGTNVPDHDCRHWSRRGPRIWFNDSLSARGQTSCGSPILLMSRTWSWVCLRGLRHRCRSPVAMIGWRVARSMQTDLVLDALEQSLWCAFTEIEGVIHHSDRGVGNTCRFATPKWPIAPASSHRSVAYRRFLR